MGLKVQAEVEYQSVHTIIVYNGYTSVFWIQCDIRITCLQSHNKYLITLKNCVIVNDNVYTLRLLCSFRLEYDDGRIWKVNIHTIWRNKGIISVKICLAYLALHQTNLQTTTEQKERQKRFFQFVL